MKDNKVVQFPVAFNSNENLVHIRDAHHNEKYFCPECGSEMIPKLGNIRVHHFAHKTYSPLCTGESGYHAAAKWLLKYYFQEHRTISFAVECDVCGRSFTITEEVNRVEVEQSEENGDIRPDVTVFFRSGEIMSCEVVYRHPLSQEKAEQYSDGKYLLVWWISGEITDVPEIQISKEFNYDDITKTSRHNKNVLKVFLTENGYKRKNSECKHAPFAEVYITDIDCYKCSHQIKVALILKTYPSIKEFSLAAISGEGVDIEYYSVIAPGSIPQELVDAINKQCGTNIYFDHSWTAQATYLMNHCTYCGAKIGAFFLGTNVMDSLDSGISVKKVLVDMSQEEAKVMDIIQDKSSKNRSKNQIDMNNDISPLEKIIELPELQIKSKKMRKKSKDE